MNSVPVDYYVLLSAILFTIGAMGVLIRRNPLIIFMSIELMLNAANLVLWPMPASSNLSAVRSSCSSLSLWPPRKWPWVSH